MNEDKNDNEVRKQTEGFNETVSVPSSYAGVCEPGVLYDMRTWGGKTSLKQNGDLVHKLQDM